MRSVSKAMDALLLQPELLVVALMVAIAAALVVPLPAWLLDFLLVANLGLSLTLLVAALHLRGPLQLSTFPTLLLIATLFRLSLNVSSTRLILGEGSAGQVIAAFGDFVVGGSYLVGIVVFVIILVIQLIVVAKGAERVAEVGARFTLDALPGKQMAIDADLRAGACTQDEATSRRRELEQESQFFGALDGAMKFVKGDAVAGLVITVVNVVGGLAVGLTIHGLSMKEAASRYTLMSIGDGLVSQLPAVLTAVAAGLIVTRASGRGILGAQLVEQLAAQPRAILASGVVLIGIGAVPGLPALPFLALGAVSTCGGIALLRREEQVSSAAPPSSLSGLSRGEAPENTTAVLVGDNGGSELIVLTLDAGVATSVFTELVERELPAMQRSVAATLGIPLDVIPVFRTSRPGASFRVIINGIPALGGMVATEPMLEASLQELAAPGTRPKELASVASNTEWLPGPVGGSLAPLGGKSQGGPSPAPSLLVITPAQAVTRELEGLIRKRAGELLSLETVQDLLGTMERRTPTLIRELERRVPTPLLWEVLVRLLDEQVSIRPLERIIEALVRVNEAQAVTCPAAALTEIARKALGRQIVHDSSVQTALPAVLLDPFLEDFLRRARAETPDGPILAIMPDQHARLVSALERELEGGAVLLAPTDLRRQLWAISRSSLARATVISYQELPPDVRVQPVSRLAVEGMEQLLSSECA